MVMVLCPHTAPDATARNAIIKVKILFFMFTNI